MPINNPPGARTRKFFVPVQVAYNVTDTAVITITANPYIALPDSKLAHVASNFIVPSDFISGLIVTFVMVPFAGGDVYVETDVNYGACGEDWQEHEITEGYTAISTVSGDAYRRCIQATSLASASAGDVCAVVTARDATNVLDTVAGSIIAAGWIVEYTADM